MNSEEKEIFRKIAGCSIANRIIDDIEARNPIDKPYKSCEKICLHQKEKFDGLRNEQVRFSKETFHMPEPWNGNLSTAEILFVSSNPSFDINETTPELARKENKEVLPKIISDPEKDDPETERALKEAEDFFENRFIKEDGSIREEYNSRTWKGILTCAGYLLEKTNSRDSIKGIKSVLSIKDINGNQKEEIARHIALTEVVHCKSTNEGGVPQALVTCYDEHTRAVIELFLKTPSEEPKKVVVMGEKAQRAFGKGILAESIRTGNAEIPPKKLKTKIEILWNELDKLRIYDPEEFEKEMKNLARDVFGELAKNAHFIFIPHAVSATSKEEIQRRIDRQYKPLRQ
ncbi:hypothetical protein Q0N48_03760 [Corynebacterium ureicelerivorans]|uniref:hypothetical protein n=1 Tax=Corynebacterium ureicelerivorans TaxID=401472 RepID=UPI00264CA869|nr:hypothetical protein [Corynebacterium ureicelerivorans]MDN8605124.1 hypothetical protein [Corynebacterium ureicelerivorans]